MENIILFIKGLIIGVCKIIPGFSGSMVMMIFGLYERAIKAITNFFDDVVGNIKFLLAIGSGIGIAIILMSKIIQLALTHYYFIVVCFFGGLILGGIPSLFKELKGTYSKSNIFLFFLFFVLATLLSFIDSNAQSSITGNAFIMFIIGIIDAATMIIPGISGTAVLMALGLYNILLEMLSNLSNFTLIISNLKAIIPFGLGLLVGGWFFIKLMDHLLTNYKIKTYWVITALALSCIILMFTKIFENPYSSRDIIIGFILLIIGYLSSRWFIIKYSE